MPVGIWLFLLALLLVGAGSAAIAGLLAAPWLPTRRKDIPRLIRLADLHDGMTIVDLGAGDGRLLLALAKAHPGIRAVGWEISLIPYLVGQLRIALSPHRKRVQLCYGNFYRAYLRDANCVVCFLTPMAMRRLSPLFAKRLSPGTRIISYAFSMPDRKPETVDRDGGTTTPFWVYRV